MGILETTKPEFMTRQAVQDRLGISQSSVFKWVSTGEFPPPVKFGRNNVWRVELVDQWIAEREAASQAQGVTVSTEADPEGQGYSVTFKAASEEALAEIVQKVNEAATETVYPA